MQPAYKIAGHSLSVAGEYQPNMGGSITAKIISPAEVREAWY